MWNDVGMIIIVFPHDWASNFVILTTCVAFLFIRFWVPAAAKLIFNVIIIGL